MFFTYLKRELTKRKRQTFLIASGLAVAISLVITVNAVSNGIQSAQSAVLANLYGVGTDLTITKSPVQGGGTGGQRFGFGGGGLQNGIQSLSAGRLILARGSGTLTAAEVLDVTRIQGVKSSTSTLKLSNITFKGTLPTGQNNSNSTVVQPAPGGADQPSVGGLQSGGNNGPRGFGGDFNINTFSVEGIQPGVVQVGPMSAVKLTNGRLFGANDVGKNVALLDSTYSKSSSLGISQQITIGGKTFSIIGLVSSTTASSDTASNVYIPLDVAQTLSTNSGLVSTVYLQAQSNDLIASLKEEISASNNAVTVSTTSDLASTISGSLGSASSLVGNLGGWLSALALLGSFLIAILFTLSGVTRRIREFGTLKAIGWRSRRIVSQVMGESLVSGVIGGAIGILLSIGMVFAINTWSPALSASISRLGNFGGGGGFPGGGGGFPGGGGGFPGGGGGFPGGGALRGSAASTTNIAFHASISSSMLILGLVFAILGGVLAGGFGGWRASRLSPSEALRSVA